MSIRLVSAATVAVLAVPFTAGFVGMPPRSAFAAAELDRDLPAVAGVPQGLAPLEAPACLMDRDAQKSHLGDDDDTNDERTHLLRGRITP